MFKAFLFFVQFYYIESFFIEEPFALNYDYFFSDNFTASLEVSSEVFLGLSYINRDYYFDFSVIGNRENIKILIGTINSYGKLLVYFNINNSELFKYKKLNFVEIGIKVCIKAYIYKKHNVYIHINLSKKTDKKLGSRFCKSKSNYNSMHNVQNSEEYPNIGGADGITRESLNTSNFPAVPPYVPFFEHSGSRKEYPNIGGVDGITRESLNPSNFLDIPSHVLNVSPFLNHYENRKDCPDDGFVDRLMKKSSSYDSNKPSLPYAFKHPSVSSTSEVFPCLNHYESPKAFCFDVISSKNIFSRGSL